MNKSKKRKIILFTIAFLWLCISIYVIQITYAKYLTTLHGTTNVALSVWSIKVNNIDITQGGTFTDSISPTFPGNEFITPGVIVPGATGYFDLVIDSSSVSMPFTYKISIAEDLELNQIADIRLSGYSLDKGTTVTPISLEESTPITGRIPADYEYTTIRVYMTWYDGEDNSLSDIDDTDISLAEGELRLTSNITFEQST